MRLLNAETKELVQFLPNKISPYAILSHTWSSDPDEEVLFSDIGKEEAKQKPAYKQKITPACKKALNRLRDRGRLHHQESLVYKGMDTSGTHCSWESHLLLQVLGQAWN
jgi:hypothetical protein